MRVVVVVVVVVVLIWVSSCTSRKCEYPNVEEEFLEATASKRKARKRTHAVVCSKWNDDDQTITTTATIQKGRRKRCQNTNPKYATYKP